MKQPLRRSASVTKRNLSAAEAGRKFSPHEAGDLPETATERREEGRREQRPPAYLSPGSHRALGHPGRARHHPGLSAPTATRYHLALLGAGGCGGSGYGSNLPHLPSLPLPPPVLLLPVPSPAFLPTHLTCHVLNHDQGGGAAYHRPRHPGGSEAARRTGHPLRSAGGRAGEGGGKGTGREPLPPLPLPPRLSAAPRWPPEGKAGESRGETPRGTEFSLPAFRPRNLPSRAGGRCAFLPSRDLPATRWPLGLSSTRSPSLHPGTGSPSHRGHRHAGLVWGRVTPSSSHA